MKRDQNLTIANVSRSLLPTLAFTLLLASPALGQTTPVPATPAPAAPAAAPAAPPSLVISAPSAAPEPKALAKSWVQVSGILDGYYDYDSNHPANGSTNPTAGPNAYTYLRNFDIRANTVSLTEAKITLSHDPGWFGFRTDVGLGSVFQVMHQSGNPTGTGLKYVEQMYVATKPPKWKGFEADFGQFTTFAGAEVIESGDNWNYSRSLLFANAIPYYHFGLRTSIPIGSAFTGGVQVVQGWNNIFDNNSGKTVGITGVYAKKYYTWSADYYVGPENNNTNVGKRNLLDTTLLLTPTGKFNAYLNYDYGQNRNANPAGTAIADLAHWQGFAGAAHGQITSKLTGTFRGEYYFFSDPAGAKGYIPQKQTEETLTGDYLFYPGVLLRAEYRHDGANQSIFDKYNKPASTTGQNTFDISLIFSFGPKT
jgi:hypothetical protein